MNDLDAVDDDHVLVFVHICHSFEGCSANHLLASGGGQLKRLASR